MPPVAAHKDHCQTAADVIAAAQKVAALRRQNYPVAAKFVAVQVVEATLMPQTPVQALPPVQEVAPLLPQREFPTIREIQDAMCWASDTRRTDMLSARRLNGIVVPRQLAMLLCKLLTNHSLPEIGRRFDGKDHTTVLHAVRKMEPVVAEIEDAIDAAPLPYLADLALRACRRIVPVYKYGRRQPAK